MAEREFSEEEVAEILRRASQRQPADATPPDGTTGLTLGALHEIGREVGIAPAAITEAARSLGRPHTASAPTLMGFVIGVNRVAEFDRPLTDADWEELVADLRDTFHARGTLRYDGRFRQWTNGNLQALLEPTASGHRLRLQSVKGDARQFLLFSVLVITAGLGFGIAAVPGGSSGAYAGMSVAVLLGVTLFGGTLLRLRRWARRRTTQMEQIIARVTARHHG
jgi:hypothetical protein